MAFMGFFTGFFIGAMMGLYSEPSTSSAGFGVFITCIILGIVDGFFAFKLYKLGAFIISFMAGFLFGIIVFQSAEAAVVIAIITGVAGVMFIKPSIIFSTAISGGLSMGYRRTA